LNIAGGLDMTSEVIWEFAKSFCVIFFITFLFSKLSIVRRHLNTKPSTLHEKLILALLFGTLSCIGSGIGIEFDGSLVNTRVIGVVVGGLLGGPITGFLSGVLASFHRIFLVTNGSTTAVICGISMIFEGVFAGLLSSFSSKVNRLWHLSTITVIICELFRKLMLLMFIKPFPAAVMLVKNLTVPMLIINSLGVIMFITYIEKVSEENEQVKARQAERILAMSEQMSSCFKQGLIQKNLKYAMSTIQENTGFEYIVITSTTSCIISNCENIPDLKISYQELLDNATEDASCFHIEIEAIHFLAAPLVDNKKIVGFLLLGRNQMPTVADSKISGGLGKLFSTQLTIGNLEYRANLLKDAEIRILQTQINPHFLFNVLTMISTFCRTDPYKARAVIDNLADFYRKNLNINAQLIPLREEIAHVKSYLEIIKAQYDSKIRIDYDVDDLGSCFIPPLSLQPLVENSIKHGLLPKKEGGHIAVRAKQDPVNHTIRIEVEDNGVGFCVGNALKESSNYVGLNNVRDRLVNFFGDDLLWEINTQPGKGTKVIIIVPAILV